jgi:hypothetical protein
MTDITFLASFGDHNKTVVLSKLLGGYYHIYVDNYYWGQVHLRQEKWVVLVQQGRDMTEDDIDVISSKIEESERKNGGLDYVLPY